MYCSLVTVTINLHHPFLIKRLREGVRQRHYPKADDTLPPFNAQFCLLLTSYPLRSGHPHGHSTVPAPHMVPIYIATKSLADCTYRYDNLGMGTWYLSGTRSDRYGYMDDFLSADGIRTWSEMRWVCDGYFFPPTSNSMGTRYFTIGIILACEQVKMCLFYYINYDLFWLLNFANRLSQIFIEY
jgi:hypothetical protein